MNKLILLILVSVSLASCKPYKTFFKKTYNSTSVISKNSKIYRLKIKSESEFDNIDSSKLTTLKSLNLSAVKNEDLNKILKKIPCPNNLSVLIMDSLQIKKLPESLFRFKNLKQISLNANPQLNLEEGLHILSKLPIEFINLQKNELYKLPENIIRLQHLKGINLSENSITDKTTFNNLSKLPNLTSFWLTNNQLKQLPDAITKLSNLKYLYVEKNQLTHLPNGMDQMKKIWVIHAGHNNFKTLPAEFLKAPNLLLLHVNNCKIEKIPEEFASKKINIKGIILDNNALSDSDKKKWHRAFKRFFLLSIN